MPPRRKKVKFADQVTHKLNGDGLAAGTSSEEEPVEESHQQESDNDDSDGRGDNVEESSDEGDVEDDESDEEDEHDDDNDEEEEDEDDGIVSQVTCEPDSSTTAGGGDEKSFDNPEEIEVFEERENEEKKSKFDRIRPKLFKSAKNRSKRLIVVLEKANLEIVKIGKNFELLNCDDHMSQIRKYKKDPAFCRPDITHQCLLMLFDSPLNRAGLLQVYIHTMNNILIEINPQTRFPRTFKRFANLMVQLLYQMCIKSSQGPEKLLRVIKNPITSHLPVGCRKIGTSFKAEKIVHPRELIPDPENEDPVVIVIGAMAHGEATVDYTEEVVSVSNYPLSGALACTKIVSAFEDAWNIH